MDVVVAVITVRAVGDVAGRLVTGSHRGGQKAEAILIRVFEPCQLVDSSSFIHRTITVVVLTVAVLVCTGELFLVLVVAVGVVRHVV